MTVIPRGPVVDPDQLDAAMESAYASDDPFCPACGYAIVAHLEISDGGELHPEICPSEAEARAYYGDR